NGLLLVVGGYADVDQAIRPVSLTRGQSRGRPVRLPWSYPGECRRFPIAGRSTAHSFRGRAGLPPTMLPQVLLRVLADRGLQPGRERRRAPPDRRLQLAAAVELDRLQPHVVRAVQPTERECNVHR